MLKDRYCTVNERSLLNHKTKVFLLCCDMRSFSAVAETLGLSVSAVSKMISALEHELGVELFERHTRPPKPTADALLLQKYLLDLSGDFAHFMTTLREKNNLKPVFRVGMLESLSLNLGVEMVRHYLPKTTHLVVKPCSGDVLVQHLNERRLDLIITNDVRLPSKRFYRYEVFEEPSILLLPRALMKSSVKVWTWERLARCGYPLLRFGEQTGAGNVNNAFLLSNNLKFPETINVEGNAFTMSLVAAGLGWVFTRPTTVLQCRHLEDRVYVAEMQPPIVSRKIYIIGRESEAVPQAQDLKAFCEDYIRRVIVPGIVAIAPWTASGIRIGTKPIDAD